jgi:hypothetical protein
MYVFLNFFYEIADQVSGRGAKTLSIEENSFIIM